MNFMNFFEFILNFLIIQNIKNTFSINALMWQRAYVLTHGSVCARHVSHNAHIISTPLSG